MVFWQEAAHFTQTESMLEESKYFIEWAAPEMEIDTAAELVQIQVELARWQQNWAAIWSSKSHRLKVARQSDLWARHILEISGLLRTL